MQIIMIPSWRKNDMLFASSISLEYLEWNNKLIKNLVIIRYWKDLDWSSEPKIFI